MSTRLHNSSASVCDQWPRNLALASFLAFAFLPPLPADDAWESPAPVMELDEIDETGTEVDVPVDSVYESRPTRVAAPVVKGRPSWARDGKPVPRPNTASPIYGIFNRSGQRPSIIGRVHESNDQRSAIVAPRSHANSLAASPILTRSQYQAARGTLSDARSSPTHLARATKPQVFQPSWLRSPTAFLSRLTISREAQPLHKPELSGAAPEATTIDNDIMLDRDLRMAKEEPASPPPTAATEHDLPPVIDRKAKTAAVPPVEIDLSADEDILPIAVDSTPLVRNGRYVADIEGRLYRVNQEIDRTIARNPSEQSRRFADSLSQVLATSFAPKENISPQAGAANIPVAIPTVRPQETAVAPPATEQQPAPPEVIAVPENRATPDANVAETPADEELFRPIGALQANIAVGEGDRPENVAETRFTREGYQPHVMGFSRFNFQTVMNWEASGLCHRPLYFEEVNLERHGIQMPILQPVISGAHFFSRIPAVPYLAVSQHQRVCNYTLGHYRPGSAAPYVWYYPNFSVDGAAVESILITGLMYAVP